MSRPKQQSAGAHEYPKLAAWLDARNARRMWVAQDTPGDSHIEAWRLGNGRGVLIECHGGRSGWDIWTNGGSIDVEETLADADARTGVNEAGGAQ